MKLSIAHGDLAAAVADTARALPARPPAPVLAALKLAAADGTLTVSGFDYEVSGEATAKADVTEPGTVLVSGRLLADITRVLKPKQPIRLTLDGARVNITSGATRYTLHTLPLGEYPALPATEEPTGSVLGADLAEAVAQVATAAGRDDTLPVLTGIQLELTGGKLTLAATDRYRFAVRTVDWAAIDTSVEEATALLPAKSLTDTVKMLAGADRIHITLPGQAGVLGLADPARSTTARTIDGQLPQYGKLWPTLDSINATVIVDSAELAAAIKRVALVAEGNKPLQLTLQDGALSLHAGTSDDAQAVDTLDAEYDSGAHDFTIAFNPTFLLDGITALAAPKTVLWMTERTKPAVLTGADAAAKLGELEFGGDALQYLLMPIRLSA
ncbi:DNA polymerase III subunit beta [Streptomyces actinomycinicus]|uniref:Beta sliding clamp n=1 Tax=Streptomyces actinomycinicus TaxID=1695166 RepID=A0A937ERE7_9ACTN|nr:DNA polymerase III subunit beta [Streptomyces actinomycinicus]MBL1086821.1 DNA polymerase III subunit beta [Streptomyces actinomycinicus]